MKKEYDFSKGRRGAAIPMPANQVRITIRIDKDSLDWFREQVAQSHGGDYIAMMNDALRAHVSTRRDAEATLRRVFREELAGYAVKKKKTR